MWLKPHQYLASTLVLAALPAWSASQVVTASEVVEQARAIALETAHSLDSISPTAFRISAASQERVATLRRGGVRAQRILKSAMTSPESSYVTRSASAYAVFLLRAARIDTVIAVLIGQMRRTAFANVRLAKSLILAIGEPAVPTLARNANDAMVLNLLGMMGPKARAAVPRLRGMLGTSNVDVAATLVAIGTSEAVRAARPVLLRALRGRDEPDKKTAVIALGQLGARASATAPQIRAVLGHGSPELQMFAAIALVDVGDTVGGAVALGKVLIDRGLGNRYPAIAKFGSLGPAGREALGDLVQALTDTSDKRFGERADVALALQRIAPGDHRVSEALRLAAREPDLRAALRSRGVDVP